MPLIRKPPTSAPEPAPASLTAGTSDERWAAARAAAGDPNNVAQLAKALGHESDPRVREAIFTSLARIATIESADAVTVYLRSDDSELRTGAFDALKAMPRATAARLPRLLADPDSDVRVLSCELVRDLPIDEANRLLCDLLEAEAEKNVCAAAVEVLAEIGTDAALPSLQRCAIRFAGDPFISFSIKVAVDRLGPPPSASRG